MGRYAFNTGHAFAAMDGNARRRWYLPSCFEGCFRVDRAPIRSRASRVHHETAAAATYRTNTQQRRHLCLLQTLQSPCIVVVPPRRFTSGPEQSLALQFRNWRRLRLSRISFRLLRWTACMAKGDRRLPQDFRYLWWLRLIAGGTTFMT